MKTTMYRILHVLPLLIFTFAVLLLWPRTSMAQSTNDHTKHHPKTEKAEVMECGPEEDLMSAHSHHMTQPTDAGSAVQPEIVDSIQVVQIAVGKMGYTPRAVTLEKDLPVRLIFTRTEDGGCTDRVQIPAFGVEGTELPLNESVTIEFTPDKAGTFTWACGMDMLKGTLLVKS